MFRVDAAAYRTGSPGAADTLVGATAVSTGSAGIKPLAGVATGAVTLSFPLEHLTEAVPSWLRELAASSSPLHP